MRMRFRMGLCGAALLGSNEGFNRGAKLPLRAPLQLASCQKFDRTQTWLLTNTQKWKISPAQLVSRWSKELQSAGNIGAGALAAVMNYTMSDANCAARAVTTS